MGRRLFWRLYITPMIGGTAAVPPLMMYVDYTTRFTDSQLSFFLWEIAAIFTPLTVIMFALLSRASKPICKYVECDDSREMSDAERRSVMKAVIEYPRTVVLFSASVWIFGGTSLALIFGWAFDASPLMITSICVTAISGGLISNLFAYVLLKRFLREVRETVAAEFLDLDELSDVVREMPFSTKLITAFTALLLVTLLFGVTMTGSRSRELLERAAEGLQAGVLDRVEQTLRDGAPLQAAVHSTQAWIEPQSVSLETLPATALWSAAGEANLEASSISAAGLELIREHGASGTTTGYDLGRHFTWRTTPDGAHLLIAQSPFVVDVGHSGALLDPGILVLLLLALAASVGIALLLSGEIRTATSALSRDLARIASGDLALPDRVFESEDEFGRLSRAIRRTLADLRPIVIRMVETAEAVEGAASKLSSVGDGLGQMAADQAEGIQHVGDSMGRLRENVGEINSFTRSLGEQVGQSLSTTARLRTGTGELNDRAAALHGKADQTAVFLTGMLESIRETEARSDQLARAAGAATESMDAIAESARQADAGATETAHLSRQVVATAEKGRDHVQRTIDGMAEISQCSRAADEVVRGLGVRTSEIGEILTVIHSVADETSLLALNAAIIAAQAGEHGRAFSVVADEIKNLANRVIRSTRQIGNLIESLQTDSTRAIEVIEGSTRSVERGVDLARQAGESLGEITHVSHAAGERVAGIVGQIESQARAAHDVAEMVSRVQDVVEQIREADRQQSQHGQRLVADVAAIKAVAEAVRVTSDEQERGSYEIATGIESQQELAQRVDGSLQAQADIFGALTDVLETLRDRIRVNERSVDDLGTAMRSLDEQAAELRREAGQFRL